MLFLVFAAVVLGLWRVYSPVWFGRRALLPMLPTRRADPRSW
jgi:hypothetical protein